VADKGRLDKGFYKVWCGICVEREDTGEVELREAAKTARARGWKLTKESGWVCPACQGRKKEPRPKEKHKQCLTTEDRDGRPISPTCVYCGAAEEYCDGEKE